MQEDPIIFTEIPAKTGNIGLITLNRIDALNALSGEMILALKQQLHTWQTDPNINIVVIRSASDKAFCAGGDLKMVYNFGRDNFASGLYFYEAEYQVNLMIHDYPKPFIALLNGITMGGGCGISLYAKRRIAGENLRLAMPEVGIGFYPDVGATYFLSHAPHKIGFYMGLTGNSIGAADAVFANLIDAFVPTTALNNILVELIDSDVSHDVVAVVDAIVAKYKQNPDVNNLQANLSTIEACFCKKTVEDIIAALKDDGSEWAIKQVNILNSRSPTSLKVTLHALTQGTNMTLAQCLNMEYALTVRMMQRNDIYEGIRAVLVDKTQDPKWDPAKLEDVDEKQIKTLFT